MNIYPTHTCFDDALEFFETVGFQDGPHTLVHGICLTPEGERYAHAWIELHDEITGIVYAMQAGLAGSRDGEQIWYAVPLDEFRADHRVQEETHYTPREALAENYRTGHYGPWVEHYRTLTGDKGRRVWPMGAREG